MIIGTGKDGLPIILGNVDSGVAPAATPQSGAGGATPAPAAPAGKAPPEAPATAPAATPAGGETTESGSPHRAALDLGRRAGKHPSLPASPSGPQSNKGRSKMNMPNDFFVKRLAAIDEEKAQRLADVEEEKAARAHADRLNQQIPLIVDCLRRWARRGSQRRKSPACSVTWQTS